MKGIGQRIDLYGMLWQPLHDPVDREMYCIRKGGQWENPNGKIAGLGLYEHYRNLEKLLWPEDDQHRWSDLGLQRIVEHEIVIFLGSADSNKTYRMAKYVLMDYWTFHTNTLWLVSSTELRGAELRIWGVLKQLFNRARERHLWLPGQVLESFHTITTEKISKDQTKGRSFNKGIIFIPCKVGGRWIGMGAMAGIKPTRNGRLGHCGDEVSFMQPAFLDAYSNWYGKPNFKGLMSANPFDLEDPSCIAAEPVEGWDNWRDTGKTQEWDSKFFGAHVVAYDGRDSPNNDYPEDQPAKFPYLIGRKKIDAVIKTHGGDSWQFFNQCVGKPRPGMQARRVITRQLCEQFHAFDRVSWLGTPTIKIGACDAAYGGVGGDRCVTGHIEFGKDVDENLVICVHEPVLVPVSVNKPGLAEDQIAEFCKQYCDAHDVPAHNFFFDARAALALSLARVWSAEVEAVDFGGKASSRPVSSDSYVWDGDKQTRRLQRCDEAYKKFVTELWFAIYQIIISDQMRQLPKDVAREGWSREWRYTANNKIEVETKEEMKERTKESPDLFDWLVTAIEGARRRGFIIARLANEEVSWRDDDWKDKLRDRAQKVRKSYELETA